MNTWQSDGWDVGVRIGVLVPHADVGPESELRAMAPPNIGIHAARVPFGAMAAGGVMDATIPLAPVRAFAEPPLVDEAVDRLAGAPVQAIAFAFTSSAYALGAEAEGKMIERLETRSLGITVVATCSAAWQALELLRAKTLALFNPPWFDAELNELGRRYFETAGLNVTTALRCALESDQKAITPSALHRLIVDNTPDRAEVVFVGGNGFRAVGIIDRLEQDLGRPVLTANQVVFWAALRAAGADTTAIQRYGRIFAIS